MERAMREEAQVGRPNKYSEPPRDDEVFRSSGRTSQSCKVVEALVGRACDRWAAGSAARVEDVAPAVRASLGPR